MTLFQSFTFTDTTEDISFLCKQKDEENSQRDLEVGSEMTSLASVGSGVRGERLFRSMLFLFCFASVEKMSSCNLFRAQVQNHN